MIHVQIASQMTAHGLAGVRWVLVEPGDVQSTGKGVAAPAAVAAAAPLAKAAATATPPGDSAASNLRLGGLKLLVVGLGLAAALWTAHVQVGPPGATNPVPAPDRGPAVPALSPPARPGAVPLAPADANPAPPATSPGSADPAAPAAPAASAALPRLTAAL